ncbi:hypothetical protein ALC56_09513 [Trachymyrmex septentrionalis]|uniref:Double jelly roll-like domain-containing protein n=1 Tax=Trachymyrmex septentrionalis TaxID=34720 RepID=A0A151JUP8_9HYME|nr:hypothetical protein ALC56_09513 [Trachymyrmex septentrionalis]
MTDILNIKDEPIFDDRIVKIETHAYNPFANTTFGYSDEIRIPIQTKNKVVQGANVSLGNNCVAFIFDEELFKVLWRMPHVLSEINKLSLLHALEGGRYLSMAFRSWDLYEFPLLQSTTKHWWAIKTTSQLEKPRYVIFAMQTGRKNIMSEDVNRFDHCKLTNAKLYLNTECYPYDLNLDFDKNRCAILYDLYARFCKGYYGYEYLEPSLTFTTFLHNGPFVIIDCSRQNESVKRGTVDVRLDFECKENVPANTTAYCLIIHDRVVQYNPLTNVVRKIT